MSATPISTTGNWAHASTTGDGAHASTTGDGAHASTTGNWAHASTTGYGAHASTTGNRAHASTTGNLAHASTTGYAADASTTGNRAHAFAADAAAVSTHGVAVGRWVMLTDTSCDALVLPCDPDRYHPYLVAVSDGWTPGRWITMAEDDDGQAWVEERPDVLAFDRRGYMLRWSEADGYTAGCRRFATAKAAIAHWSNPDHKAPDSAAILRAAVEAHAATYSQGGDK